MPLLLVNEAIAEDVAWDDYFAWKAQAFEYLDGDSRCCFVPNHRGTHDAARRDVFYCS